MLAHQPPPAKASTAATIDDRPDGGVLSAQVATIVDQLSQVPDERDYRVTEADIAGALLSIGLRLVGIAINARLAWDFYEAARQADASDGGGTERFAYFVWTVGCLTVPMLITASLQVAFYFKDVNEHRTKPRNVLCCVILMPLFLRYWHSVQYAIASKRAERRGDRAAQIRYYQLLIHQDSDVALIRIFECFLEVAPQKILQLYIILRSQQRQMPGVGGSESVAAFSADVNVLQLLSIGSAVLSMGWCIAAYHRAIRWSQVDKAKLSWAASLCQWLSHFLIALARVCAIALVASCYPAWTLAAGVVHLLLMTVWLLVCDRSPFCAGSCTLSAAFAVVLGAVFVFTYVLPRPRRRTAARFAAFYALCGAENGAAVAAFVWRWSLAEATAEWSGGWLRDGRVVAVLSALAVVPFVAGVALMVGYYVRLHPNVVVRKRQAREQQQQEEVEVGRRRSGRATAAAAAAGGSS